MGKQAANSHYVHKNISLSKMELCLKVSCLFKAQVLEINSTFLILFREILIYLTCLWHWNEYWSVLLFLKK